MLLKYHARPSFIFDKLKDSMTDRRKFMNYAKHAYKLYNNLRN